MCIIKLYKKVDGKLKRAPIRTLNFYNNLISGILGGAFIYYVISDPDKINILKLSIFFYLIGLWIIHRNTKELVKNSRKNQFYEYHWNLLAAIMGGFYLVLLFEFSGITPRIISTGIILLIFITISYFRINSKKKK